MLSHCPSKENRVGKIVVFFLYKLSAAPQAGRTSKKDVIHYLQILSFLLSLRFPLPLSPFFHTRHPLTILAPPKRQLHAIMSGTKEDGLDGRDHLVA